MNREREVTKREGPVLFWLNFAFLLLIVGFVSSLWLYGTLLIFFMLMTPLLGQTMPDSETFQEVTRLNYGVVYTPVRLMTLVSDEWSHIFDLHLPNVTTVDPELELPQCDAAISNDVGILSQLFVYQVAYFQCHSHCQKSIVSFPSKDLNFPLETTAYSQNIVESGLLCSAISGIQSEFPPS